MADVFLYADETGNLDYNATSGRGGSLFFGFGSAVFPTDHPDALWNGMRLRAELSRRGGGYNGLDLRAGFHAVNDSVAVRHRVFSEIQAQAPRFDATFLKKQNAYGYVRAKGEMYLYKYAWYRHLIRVAPQVATRNDTLYVIVARLGTARRHTLAQAALEDVCRQTGLNIALCVWDSSSSWGLQVADYGSWAMQRQLEMQDGSWYTPYIQPTTQTRTYPWGV